MIWKIKFPSEETITLTHPPSDFTSLTDIIKAKAPKGTPFCLKYLDSENELINLTNQEDLDTAILSNSLEHLKAMNIFIIPAPCNEKTPKKTQQKPSLNTQSTSDSVKKSAKSKAEISREPQLMKRGRDVGRSLSVSKRISSAPSEAKDHFMLSVNEKPESRKEKRQKSVNSKGDFMEHLKKLTDEKVAEKVNSEMAGALPILFKTLRDLYGIRTPIIDGMRPGLPSAICYKCKKPSKEIKCVCKECCFGNKESGSDRARSEENQNEEGGPQSPHVARRERAVKTEVKQPEIKRKLQRFSTYPIYLSLRRNPARKDTNQYKVSLLPSTPDKVMETRVGESYKVGFQLKNCGDLKWPENTRLVCINGLNKGIEKLLPSLEPGRQITIELTLHAPKEAGKYLSQWRVSYGKAEKLRSFGESLFEEILVKDSPRGGFKGKSSRESVFNNWNEDEGRQGQEEMNTPKKSVEKGVPIALICQEDRAKCAEYLNEILPGELEEKKKFVNTLPENCSIFDVVEKYLVKLGAQKNSRHLVFDEVK
jgi:hypothetical protein